MSEPSAKPDIFGPTRHRAIALGVMLGLLLTPPGLLIRGVLFPGGAALYLMAALGLGVLCAWWSRQAALHARDESRSPSLAHGLLVLGTLETGLLAAQWVAVTLGVHGSTASAIIGCSFAWFAAGCVACLFTRRDTILLCLFVFLGAALMYLMRTLYAAVLTEMEAETSISGQTATALTMRYPFVLPAIIPGVLLGRQVVQKLKEQPERPSRADSPTSPAA